MRVARVRVQSVPIGFCRYGTAPRFSFAFGSVNTRVESLRAERMRKRRLLGAWLIQNRNASDDAEDERDRRGDDDAVAVVEFASFVIERNAVIEGGVVTTEIFDEPGAVDIAIDAEVSS